MKEEVKEKGMVKQTMERKEKGGKRMKGVRKGRKKEGKQGGREGS